MNGKCLKISYFKLMQIFAIVFTIMPSYFVINGVGVRNIITILFFLVCVINFLQLKPNIRFGRNRWMYWMMLLWVFVFSNIALLHGQISFAVLRVILWSFISFCCIDSINSKEKFIKLIDILIYTSAFVAICGIVEEFTNFNFFFLLNNSGSEIDKINRTRMGLIRLISFTSHPISYCVYCMFSICLTFYRFSLPERKKKTMLKVIYIVLVVNAILTVSRGAIIGIIFSQLIMLWFCGYRKFFKRAFQIAGISVICIIILYFFSENTRRIVQIPYVMLRAIFNEDYESKLSLLGFEGNNTNGIGQRFQLYGWVWEGVQGHLLLGNGPTSNISRYFTNAAGYTQLKQSIEVQILITLYRFGIIGMLAEMSFYTSILLCSFQAHREKPACWEGKFGFGSMSFALIFSYIIVLFTVMQNEDAQIFFWVFILLSSYVVNGKFKNG